MKKPFMTNEQFAKRMGCTLEQAQAAHVRNAEEATRMAAKARAKSGKVNGYTADEWDAMAVTSMARSKAP